MSDPRGALMAVLGGFPRLAVAVSGGVDSMTLAWLAHRRLPGRVRFFHAVSPAVPATATSRVRAYAAREGWDLAVIEAGELDDPRYRANPVDRCFWCKSGLYGTIRSHTADPIASGTNLDDLGDYRPGLRAAEDHGVRHPYVEAGIAKRDLRRLAAAEGLLDLAELPAAPCLASRLETGLEVTVGRLAFVEEAERLLQATFGPGTMRCRLRADTVEIQLEQHRLAEVEAGRREELRQGLESLKERFALPLPLRFAPYVRGSAFLHGPRHA
ncbi:hypothetical protein SH611_14995 [Geminicoccaceae bacterium 1502E]|nr:hypothetical protein [Geminicoccaceae bacterium 1502E]